jgi:hypothetical protein
VKKLSGSTNAFVRISVSRRHIWEFVGRSEIVRNSVTPSFTPFMLPVNKLCYAQVPSNLLP